MRGYRFSVDSVILPHVIEGHFVRVVELGAGCGIMALQLFAHERALQFYLVENDKVHFEALEMTIAVNELQPWFYPIFGDVAEMRIDADLVYFNPPFGRGRPGKGGPIAPFLRFLERNKYAEVAYVVPPELDVILSEFLVGRMHLKKEVQVWYKRGTRIIKQWSKEKAAPKRAIVEVPSDQVEQMYWDCP